MTLEEHELYLKRKKELESEARKHVAMDSGELSYLDTFKRI